MSYEGTEELLCKDGHYTSYCASLHLSGDNKGVPKRCRCGKKFEWQASVDHTNGYNKKNPWTFLAPKKEVGFDDVPRIDHHGNKYFIKNMKYKPVSRMNRWSKVEYK